MAQIVRKQDLPPPGGYKPIPFERIKAKTLFSGYAMFGGFVVMNTFAIYLYSLNYHKIMRERVEMRSATYAMYPMLLAERDREFLKQCNRNRLEEEKIMAGVEGWKVGTFYGEPIYKTIPEDKWKEPIFHEYYAHASPKGWRKINDFKYWT